MEDIFANRMRRGGTVYDKQHTCNMWTYNNFILK